MRKYWLINLALLAVVSGLAIFAWLAPAQREADAPPAYVTLSRRDPKQAQHIRIERPPGEVIELDKNPQGEWQLSAPLRLAANPFRVQQLLGVLNARSERQLDARTVKLPDFGLQPPQAVLWIDDLKLEFGNPAPLGGHRYARLGETVHVLADTGLDDQLLAEAASLASLSPLGKGALESVETPAYRLFRQENGWRLANPDGTPATLSADAINRLAEDWQHLQAFAVHAYAGENPGLAQISARLASQDQPLVLRVTAREPDLRLADAQAGVVYQFPTQLAASLLALPQSE